MLKFLIQILMYTRSICTTQNLESVQNRFIHFLSFKFKVERLRYSNNYDDIFNIIVF